MYSACVLVEIDLLGLNNLQSISVRPQAKMSSSSFLILSALVISVSIQVRSTKFKKE